MLTIFTTFKPFTDKHIATIQRNALQSWLALVPKPEIILFGNDTGAKEIATEFNVVHIPDVKTNQGLPLISSLFGQAQAIATFPLLCYANGDIIFMQDLIKAINQIIPSTKQFLAVGRRHDLAIKDALNFSGDWQAGLRQRLGSEGVLHGYSGIDYFLFTKGLYRHIPPLVVGRGGWDNWMIYSVRKRSIPVIDITPAATAVHQEHDAPNTRHQAARFHDKLAQENLLLAGGYGNLFTIREANFILEPRNTLRFKPRDESGGKMNLRILSPAYLRSTLVRPGGLVSRREWFILTKGGMKRNFKGIAFSSYPFRLFLTLKRYLQHLWKH